MPISPEPSEPYEPVRARPSSGRSARRFSCCAESGASVAQTAMHEPSLPAGRIDGPKLVPSKSRYSRSPKLH